MVNSLALLPSTIEVSKDDTQSSDQNTQENLKSDLDDQSLELEQNTAEHKKNELSSDQQQQSLGDKQNNALNDSEKKQVSKIQQSLHSIHDTVKNYPLICLGTMWGVIAISGFFAIEGLFIIEAEPDLPQYSPSIEQVEPQRTVPWWILVLIPVGCATAGLGMALVLKYALSQPPKNKRPLSKRRFVKRTKQQRQHPRSSHPLPNPVPVEQPIITVLPPEPDLTNHPSSLANMMDMRKRHSLSSLLKD